MILLKLINFIEIILIKIVSNYTHIFIWKKIINILLKFVHFLSIKTSK